MDKIVSNTSNFETGMDYSSGFDWDNEIQGHLLSAYSIGYVFGNLMGGSICAFFGAKRYMAVSMVLAGLVQLASPLAALQGPWFLYTLRLLFGASVSISYISQKSVKSQLGFIYCVRLFDLVGTTEVKPS